MSLRPDSGLAKNGTASRLEEIRILGFGVSGRSEFRRQHHFRCKAVHIDVNAAYNYKHIYIYTYIYIYYKANLTPGDLVAKGLINPKPLKPKALNPKSGLGKGTWLPEAGQSIRSGTSGTFRRNSCRLRA